MAEALGKLDGGSSIAELAKEYGVDEKQIIAWNKSRDRIFAKAGVASSAGAGSTGSSSGGIGGLASALGVAASDTPPGPRETKAEPIETVTPEQLLTLISAIDRTMMKAIAGGKASHVPRATQDALMQIDEGDLKAMAMLAPYAADYAPLVMKYMKPIMAGAFVGVWAFSCVTRLKDLTAAERRELERLDKEHRAKKGNPS